VALATTNIERWDGDDFSWKNCLMPIFAHNYAVSDSFENLLLDRPMQYVLDLNMSRDPKLAEYLRDGHQIILIDAFFVEIFKADFSIPIFQRNVKIIKEFPSSIFYGKDRGDLVREEMTKGAPLSANDLLCQENTQKIRTLVSLDASQLELSIQSFKSEAEKRVSESDVFTEEFIRGLSGKADLLDIKEYRSNNELLEKHVFEVAMSILERSLKDEFVKSFTIFKFKSKKSVSYFQNYILLWRVLHWALNKGYQNATKLGNDNFDLKYVLSSCFFDGLLTKEKWLRDCRSSALSSTKYMVSYSSDREHLVTDR
jgi:hypothetical protein